jgi:outer membrane murein-binding lipoprotein Lpp
VSSPTPTETAAKPEPLTITPQITPLETDAAQQQTNLSLSIAEHNMLATQGKPLNAGQTDLASKVRSFIAEAREAAHNSDWPRARNAAKKAEVLSEQLASSIR